MLKPKTYLIIYMGGYDMNYINQKKYYRQEPQFQNSYPGQFVPNTAMPGKPSTPIPNGPAPITTTPPDFEQEPGAPVQQDTRYTQGYLREQIGKYVKVEFLIGTNMFIDREGTLVDVGISYIIIREPETDDLVLADIYSIKFVKIYY